MTGQTALGQLPTTDADLVMSDVLLPGMSGIDLLGEVGLQRPELPCLMLAGHQETIYVQRALAAGAKGYVAQGNPLELTTAIQQVLAGDIYLNETIRQKLSTTET